MLCCIGHVPTSNFMAWRRSILYRAERAIAITVHAYMKCVEEVTHSMYATWWLRDIVIARSTSVRYSGGSILSDSRYLLWGKSEGSRMCRGKKEKAHKIMTKSFYGVKPSIETYHREWLQYRNSKRLVRYMCAPIELGLCSWMMCVVGTVLDWRCSRCGRSRIHRD